MKKLCDSMSDIISNLPAALLENILICMPLRDAVRTSCLSKKWRYVWDKIPQLVFDEGIVTTSDIRRQDNLVTRDRILRIIFQVLMLHREPILKFNLSIRELEGCPEIDTFITFLTAAKGVEELTLQIWKGGYYKLPSSLFSCQRLTHLKLRCCIFTPPATFEGFFRLVCLELCEVIFSIDALARLISTCPLLEQLRLETSITCDHLEIDSGSLKRSYFIGNFKSISFKNTSHLAVVSLLSKELAQLPTKGDSFDWFGFFTNLPALKDLEIDQHYVKSLASTAAPKMPIRNTWRTLESLRLYGISLDLPVQICLVLCLIFYSNLRKVTIEAKSNGQNVQSMDYLRKCRNLVFNDKLREVQLGIRSGTDVELEFIKLILAKSRVLEKMVVKPDPGRVRDGGLKILREFENLNGCRPRQRSRTRIRIWQNLVEESFNSKHFMVWTGFII